MGRKKTSKNACQDIDVPQLSLSTFGRVLRRAIVSRQDVIDFRAEYCGGRAVARRMTKTWNTINPEESPGWNALDSLSNTIAERYQISLNDAMRAIVLGDTPSIPLVTHQKTLLGMDALNATRLVFSVNIMATPAQVAAAYTQLRRRVLQAGEKTRVKPLEAKAYTLASFAAEHGEESETLAGLAKWNRAHPHWAYERPAFKTYRRDLSKAWQDVLHGKSGAGPLPGIVPRAWASVHASGAAEGGRGRKTGGGVWERRAKH